MWHLAVREDDLVSAQSMLQRYRGEVPWSFRAYLARAQGNPGDLAALLDAARGSENRQMQIAARNLMVYRDEFALADSLLALELEWRQRPAVRQGSRVMKAWLETGRGRWSAALVAFRQAEPEGAPGAKVEAALAAALPFLSVPPSDLREIHYRLAAWRPEADPPERSELATALRPHLRTYLLGLLSSRLGERNEALRQAAALEQAGPPPGGEAVLRGLARTLRADVAWQSGRAREVIELLEVAAAEVPLELISTPAYATARPYGQEHARYLLAAALVAERRRDDARRWLATGFQGAPNEFAYHAPVSRMLGELEESLGNRTAARTRYERFVRLWADADPAQRRQVEEVKKRLRG
ncbi:MAG: hypothetical protein ACT4PM_03050 [Gemmatimonadales bacterium]